MHGTKYKAPSMTETAQSSFGFHNHYCEKWHFAMCVGPVCLVLEYTCTKACHHDLALYEELVNFLIGLLVLLMEIMKQGV